MSTIVIVVLVIVLIGAIASVLVRRLTRTRRLRHRFGPEYDRAVEAHGGRARAEADLLSRERRHRELVLRPLAPRRRELFLEQWTQLQERFIDAPHTAVEEAERLVTSTMTERGYPAAGFEDQMSHLSVEHGGALDDYRRGHEIGVRAARDQASTEDLRQAMVHYRALFQDLLAAPTPAPSATGRHAGAAGAGGGRAPEPLGTSQERHPPGDEKDRRG